MLEQLEKDLITTNEIIAELAHRRKKLYRAIINLRYLYQNNCEKEQAQYDNLTKQLKNQKRIRYRQIKTINYLKGEPK